MTITTKILEEQNPLVDNIYQNLISINDEDGLSKYQELARFLIYRIPVWKVPQTNRPPPFVIETIDLSEDIKREILSLSSTDIEYAKSVVKEAVSLIFESLGDRKKEYFHKRVKDMLEVRFV